MSLLCQCYQSILLGVWELLRHMFCVFSLLFVHPSFFPLIQIRFAWQLEFR